MISDAAFKKVLNGLDDYLLEMMNKHTLAGLAVGVVRAGRLVYTSGQGFADIAKGRPVSMDTTFRIASISKTFTAIGIMQLWEQGMFKLDDPVNSYLKDLIVMHKDPLAPPVTFRHMLTHTSGIGEAPTVKDGLLMLIGKDRSFIKSDAERPPLSELYDGLFLTDVPAQQKWAYANHAFAILGKLVEDISGMPFPEYMISNVFEPLGMLRTDYLFSERVRDEFAQGYNFKKGAFKPVPFKPRTLMGAGSVISSVNEMAKYMAALMNGGANEHGRVLKAETLKLMMSSQLDTDPRIFSMGLAFWLDHYGGHLVAGHGGSQPGFISDMKVTPEEKLGVIVFTNTGDMAPEFIGTEIMHRLLGVANPDADFPPKGILSQPHDWARFTGFYGPKPGFLTNARLWMMGGEMEVYVDGQNRLALRALVPPLATGMPIYRVDPQDSLLYRGQIKGGAMDGYAVPILFEQNHEGGVDRLFVMQDRLYKRPRRQSLRYKVTTILRVLGGAAGLLVLYRLLKKKN
jgi:CubicO group peptidase (beta-lactamase class C family)